jgi:hypothetical protein
MHGIVMEGPAGDYFGDYWPDCDVNIKPDLPVVSLLFYDPQVAWQPGYGRLWPWTGFGDINAGCAIE